MQPIFPTDPNALTPELLTAALGERHPGVEVAGLRVVDATEYGVGQVSTADRVTLDLDYASGRDAGLPTRILLKTYLALPHAPKSMYRNEVRFYRDVRPELDIEAPRVFASTIDEDSGQFGVLMEDLNLRGARFPNATTHIELDQVADLLDTLAKLHARYWQSPALDAQFSWVPTPLEGGMHNTFTTFGKQLVGAQLENPLKAEIVAPLGRSLDDMWTALWKIQAVLADEPRTLLHGDTHIGNTYLLPDGHCGLLDWQLMVRGRWSHDVTYLLVTALETEVRRAEERRLLDHYLAALRGHGVDAPNAEAAFALHRRTVVWGLVIGWLITPPANYGDAITAANVSRLVAAALDHETFELIDAM
jgi:aminoglycoside phosphotransferase (APT) family kinase protein